MSTSEILNHLETILEVSKQYYPDDDAKNAGYREAIKDIIEFIKDKKQ